MHLFALKSYNYYYIDNENSSLTNQKAGLSIAH